MATYHLTVKAGKKGMAKAHAEYISRDGKYSEGKRYEDLEFTKYGNMPAWAEHTPLDFWEASDNYERANGSAYREIEIALPRELTPEQRLELVKDFVTQEIGEKHAYQFAIHTPKAALEKGEQPHAHIMYSERMRDGIERDPEQYFKRYNAKNPEKGGAKKSSGGKLDSERKEELKKLRERWAIIQNKHLEKYGHGERVTHLSLEEQGIIDRQPEKHLGGSGVRNKESKNKLLELRAVIAESVQVNADAQKIVMDVKANSAWNKYNERKAQVEAEKLAAEEAKKAQIEQAEREWNERISREVAENIKRGFKALAEKEVKQAIEQGKVEINIIGLDEMRRQVWIEAEACGLKTIGYIPTESDKAALTERQKENPVTQPIREATTQPPAQKTESVLEQETTEQREKRAADTLLKLTTQAKNRWRETESEKLFGEVRKMVEQNTELRKQEPKNILGLNQKKWQEWADRCNDLANRHNETRAEANLVKEGKSASELAVKSQFEQSATKALQQQHPELYQALIDKAARERAQAEEARQKKEQEQQQTRLVRKNQRGKDDFER